MMGTGLLRMLTVVLAVAFMSSSYAQQEAVDYRLGDGDTISVSIFQNPDLNRETRVSENGSITFPLVGSVKIGGLTISDAEQAIAAALKAGDYIKEPQVSIQLLKNSGNQVSVLGQVARPGRFPLETFRIKLSEILAIAGGITQDGSDTIVVTGIRGGTAFRKEVDISRIFVQGNSADDFIVRGGDVVFVPKQPMYYIYGEVQRPGSYRLESNMTVRQALVIGGGPSARGTERGIEVFRKGNESGGSKIGLDDEVKPNDVLHVGQAWF